MIVYTKDSSRITRELSLFNQQSSSGFYFWLILKRLPVLKYFGVSRKNRTHYLQSQYPNSLRGIVSNIYPDSGQNTP